MYSAAFNSFDHLSGSADPATGTYSFTETFGPVQADGQLGPKCNLIMSYSLLSTMNTKNMTGLGRGWSFRLGNYSRSGKTLTLNTGASYVVFNANPIAPWTLSHKLKDIRVEQKDDQIQVYHKNGDLEVMDMDPDTQDAVLTRFISANGRYLEFEYRHFLGYQRLHEVRDKNHTLATVTYNDNDHNTVIVTYPNTPDEKTTTLYMTPEGLLDTIEQTEGEYISFKYQRIHYTSQQVTLYPITTVNYSNGASEEMEYNEKLHLPNRAPVPYTPGITKHTKIIATNQPNIITTFNYRDKDGQPARNYWGYDSGISWTDRTDGLFNYPSYYHYTSTTQCGNKVIHYIYNKFHQKVSTIETNGDNTKQQITTHEYYSDGRKVLDEQPITYELMKSATTKYVSSCRVSHDHNKSYEYDDWGNILVETDIYGMRTVSEYYPPEGGNGCPPHPHGMVAYIKRRSYISSDSSLVKSFSYTYQSIPRSDGDNTIVPASKVYGNVKETYSYYDSTDLRVQGAQKSKTTTINGKSITKSASYEFPNNDTVHITETVTGHDGLSTNTSTVLSYWNGLVKQERDEAGVISQYTHDTTGRTVSVTSGVGTDYQVITNYQYVHNPIDPSSGRRCIGLQVIQETKLGATVHTFYDGNENELTVYQKDKHGILRKLSENNYDELGRKVSHVQFDYVISEEADHNIIKTISNQITTVYGVWGSKCETVHSDGTSQLTNHDPIKNKVTQQVVRKDRTGKIIARLHSTKTYLNSIGKPSKVQVFNKSGELYSTTLLEYDSFGRKSKVTGPMGKVAEITRYDAMDRPVEFKHYDGTIFQVSYTDVSIQSLVSSITVPSMDVTLGQQEYDGLSRVTSKTVNGVKTQFSYKDGYSKPSRRINGRGQTLLFDYIPELDMQTSRVASFSGDVQIGDWDEASKISESVYTYGKFNDIAFGQILSATSPGSQYSYEYSSLGALKTTKQVVGTHSRSITNEHTTMGGKPISVKIGDRKVTYNRNERGNVTSIIDGDIMIEVTMDEFSRVSKKVVKQYHPSSGAYDDLLQTTDTSYDEYSREIVRTITIEKSGKVMSIKTAYDTEDKIVQRDVTINNTDSLSESYNYDSKKRLTSYEVTTHTTDTLLPRNENGKPFTSQTFAFDRLDNITSIVTRFPNGNIDTATLIYDQTNKQRLIRISHTLTTGGNAYPGCITLQYDADGNVTSYKDSVMTYTVSGRLATKDDRVYSYDPFDRLVKSKDTVRVYSDESHVIQEINDSGTTDYIRYGNIPVGEILNGRKKIYGVDQSFTTVSVTEDTSTTAVTYSPYGHGDSGARIGLNGELRDIGDSNVYHLGNGTRTYFPSFNGFSSADSYSPFLGGGINPYKYCSGDPVNAIDPSGHVSLATCLKLIGLTIAVVAAVVTLIAVPFTAGSSLGLTLGIIAGICGVASSTLALGAEIAEVTGHKKVAKGLTIASTVFGILSAVFSIGQIAADIGLVIRAGMAARSTSSEIFQFDTMMFKIAEKDTDTLWTTAFKTKYTITRQALSEEKAAETFVKSGVGELKKVTEVKIGHFYWRTIREPVRVFRGGEYAGMLNIVSKSGILSRTATGLGRLGTVFTSTSSVLSNINDSSNGNQQPPVAEGSDPTVTNHIQSSCDLPNNKPAPVEKLLFTNI